MNGLADQLQEARTKLTYSKDGADIWVVELGDELVGEWERSGMEMNPRMAISKPSWSFVVDRGGDDPVAKKLQPHARQLAAKSFEGRTLPGEAKKWLAGQLKTLGVL